MKKLKKLTRKQKQLLIKNNYNYQEWLLERQDSKSYTFVNRKNKEILKLNFYK